MKTPASKNGIEPMQLSKERSKPSADEIRKKLEEKKLKDQGILKGKEDSVVVELGERTSELAKASGQPGAQEEAKGVIVPADSLTNDPQDPTTKEKLKQLLSTGGFSFNVKERQVLEKILKDQ